MANNKSLQFLRGTKSIISSSTEVALAGQPVFATDTNELLIGDGSTQIKNLTPINMSGSYPTLGAGYLQDFLVENTTGTSGIGWWHILSIPSSNLSGQGAYSLIFLINEVYHRATSGQGQSGLLEIDLQTMSGDGITSASINILGGNLLGSQICITFNNTQADVYYYLDSTYEATVWTRLSEGLENGRVEPRYSVDKYFYQASAPGGAVYAVNRNIAVQADNDNKGQNIADTYIKGLSVSGRTITYTKGDGDTGTITTQDSNTDTMVSQYSTTTNNSYPLLFKYTAGTSASTTVTEYARYNNNIYVNPSTGGLYVTNLTVSGQLDFSSLSTKAANALLNMVSIDVGDTQTTGSVTYGDSMSSWQLESTPTMYRTYTATHPAVIDVPGNVYPYNITITGGTASVGSSRTVGWNAGSIQYNEDSSQIIFVPYVDRSLFATTDDVTTYLQSNPSVKFTYSYTPITKSVKQ